MRGNYTAIRCRLIGAAFNLFEIVRRDDCCVLRRRLKVGALKTFDKSRISRRVIERVVRFAARIVEIEYAVGEADDNGQGDLFMLF